MAKLSALSTLRASLSAALPSESPTEKAVKVLRPAPFEAKKAAVSMLGVSEEEGDLYAVSAFLSVKPEDLTPEVVARLSTAIVQTMTAHPQTYQNKKTGEVVTDGLPLNGFALSRRGRFVVAFLKGKPVQDPVNALAQACDLVAKARPADAGGVDIFAEVMSAYGSTTV